MARIPQNYAGLKRLPDPELAPHVVAMIGGDGYAREVVILGMVSYIVATVRKYRPRQDADFEDAIQEAFLHICQCVRRFQLPAGVDSPGHYFTSVTGKWCDRRLNFYFDRLYRHHRRFKTENAPAFFDAFAAAAVGVSDEGDVLDRLRYLVRELPRRMPEVIRLRFGLDGGLPLTTGEIARRVGVARNSVGRHEHAALRALRDELDRDFPSLAVGGGEIADGNARRCELRYQPPPPGPELIAELTPAHALEIVRLRRDGLQRREIARRIGCVPRLVGSVLKGNLMAKVTGIKPGSSAALSRQTQTV